MKPYLLFFAAVYSIALVLLITVLIFGLKLGGITLLPALIAAAFISAGHFVKKEQRLPSSDEKIQLVWGSSAVAIIIGSFFVFFLVLMNPNAEEILKAVEKYAPVKNEIIEMLLNAPEIEFKDHFRLNDEKFRRPIKKSRDILKEKIYKYDNEFYIY